MTGEDILAFHQIKSCNIHSFALSLKKMIRLLVGQTILDESNASLPSDIHPAENNLNSISTSPLEVEYIFKSLQLGKASGPDEISNRILKRLATLILSVSHFSIFSLPSGNVPLKIRSEYDQEIPQSQTADNPMAPRGTSAQPSRDTRKTN